MTPESAAPRPGPVHTEHEHGHQGQRQHRRCNGGRGRGQCHDRAAACDRFAELQLHAEFFDNAFALTDKHHPSSPRSVLSSGRAAEWQQRPESPSEVKPPAAAARNTHIEVSLLELSALGSSSGFNGSRALRLQF
jgi:hypothetical protein